MQWIYWIRLYETKFQAGCFATRIENDGWLYGFENTREIEVFRSKKGRYGVRFLRA